MGRVRILLDLEIDLAGRDVLLVEDIVDTGLTLRYLLGVLRARGPGVARGRARCSTSRRAGSSRSRPATSGSTARTGSSSGTGSTSGSGTGTSPTSCRSTTSSRARPPIARPLLGPPLASIGA